MTLHQSNIQKYIAHPPEELIHTAQGLIFSKQEVEKYKEEARKRYEQQEAGRLKVIFF